MVHVRGESHPISYCGGVVGSVPFSPLSPAIPYPSYTPTTLLVYYYEPWWFKQLKTLTKCLHPAFAESTESGPQ